MYPTGDCWQNALFFSIVYNIEGGYPWKNPKGGALFVFIDMASFDKYYKSIALQLFLYAIPLSYELSLVLN